MSKGFSDAAEVVMYVTSFDSSADKEKVDSEVGNCERISRSSQSRAH